MKIFLRLIAVAVFSMSAATAFAQSGYQMRGDHIYYGNIILHDADPYTFMDLGYGYAKDRDNVWWEGRILPMVDARTFSLKNAYAGHPNTQPGQPNNIFDYFIGQVISQVPNYGTRPEVHHVDRQDGRPEVHHVDRPDGRPGDHPGGHPGACSGVHYQRGYEIAGNNVYYNGQPVSGVSVSSFRDLGWGYAKDKYKVYYEGRRMDARAGSFKVLSDGYALDNFDVYYYGEEIDASTSRFTVLSDGYAKDAFDAYYCGKEVKGSVASSFVVLGNGYAKDSFDTYYLGKKVD